MISPMGTISGLEDIQVTTHGSGLTSQVSTLIMTTVSAIHNAYYKLLVTLVKAGLVPTAVQHPMSITLFASLCKKYLVEMGNKVKAINLGAKALVVLVCKK